jgi:hypothetical protein
MSHAEFQQFWRKKAFFTDNRRKEISYDVLLESGRAEMPITVRLENDLVENFPIVGDLVKQGKNE